MNILGGNTGWATLGVAMIAAGALLILVTLGLALRWNLVGMMGELSGSRKAREIKRLNESTGGVLGGDSELFNRMASKAGLEERGTLPRFRVENLVPVNGTGNIGGSTGNFGGTNAQKVDLGREVKTESEILTGTLNSVPPMVLEGLLGLEGSEGDSETQPLIDGAGEDGFFHGASDVREGDFKTGVLPLLSGEERYIETGALVDGSEADVETGVLGDGVGAESEAEVETGFLGGVSGESEIETGALGEREVEAGTPTGVLGAPESAVETSTLVGGDGEESVPTGVLTPEDAESGIETSTLGVDDSASEGDIHTGVLDDSVSGSEGETETGFLVGGIPALPEDTEGNGSVEPVILVREGGSV